MLKELYDSSSGQPRLLLTVLLDHLGRPRDCRTPVELLMQIQGKKLKSHTKAIHRLRVQLNPLQYQVYVRIEYIRGIKHNIRGKTWYRIAPIGMQGTFPSPIKKQTVWEKIKKIFTF